MMTRRTSLLRTAVVAAGLALSACGGGGGGTDGSPTAAPSPTQPPSGSNPPPTTAKVTTPGVWKGTMTSSTTGQTTPVVALTGHDGQSTWMTTDGRIWHGQVPMSGDHFNATFNGHMYEGAHFPDGTNHGPSSIMVDHHTESTTTGHYSGSGDTGSFDMTLSPMWDRASSPATVAGVYTRSTSSGYTMTMTIDANGHLTGSDTLGCVFSGSVTVPDPIHNMYDIDAQVSSCGSLDGHYQGMGTLLDADAMQDWMSTMHPLEHGGHMQGGPMMGGHHGSGHNTVPTGQHNLFMFSLVSDHNAIMDALAR